MPDQRPAPVLIEKQPELEPYVFAAQKMEDEYALGVVKRTFFQYESWRQNNHQPRWWRADMLYFGNVEQRYWEGTGTKRSALAHNLTFDQIEAALPRIMQALFGFDDWFEVLPRQETQPAQARAVREHLLYLLEASADEYDQSTYMEVYQVLKSALTYGNGFLKLEYDFTKKHPVVVWVDIRDIYVDPGTPGPSLEKSRAVIERKLMSVEELNSLRGTKNMRIPDLAVLRNMSMNRQFTAGDLAKQQSETARQVIFAPGSTDLPVLPAAQDVEVLIYTSRDRIIWVLNREWIAYNQKNPYGFINYCAMPCYSVLGRFYGMGIADEIGDFQLYAQTLRNLHLDELHLALQPPRVRKRGVALPAGQLKWGPGSVIEAESPKEDMIVHFPNGASANVDADIMAIEVAAEKRTGVNALASGVPRPGNANRTLGGMQMQGAGGDMRLSTIVKNAEDYLIAPMLRKLYRMTQVHSTPEKRLPQTGEEQTSALDFFSPVKFEFRAASRMVSSMAAMQSFPFLMQYLTQGPFMEELRKQQKTVDWMELFDMMQFASGTKRRWNLVRPMSEEEIQASQTPDPQTAAGMQKAQLDAQTRMQMGQLKANTELVKHRSQYEAKIAETEEKTDRKLLEAVLEIVLPMMNSNSAADREKAQVELSALLSKQQLDAAGKQQELYFKGQQQQQDLLHERNNLGLKFAAQRAQHRQDLDLGAQRMAFEGQQSAFQNDLSGRKNSQDLWFNQARKSQELDYQKSLQGLKSKAPRDPGLKRATKK